MRLDLFRGQVKFFLIGRFEDSEKETNYHPLSVGAGEKIRKLADHFGAEEIFVPRLNFTNKIISTDFDLSFYSFEDCFWQTHNYCDGLLTEKRNIALGICNADCFVGVLFSAFYHRLCVVHLGLKNIYREDDSISTLESAVRAMAIDPQEISFWCGGGIQKCCYGSDDRDLISKLKKRFGSTVVNGVVVKGPRIGARTIDLHNIIAIEASRLKLKFSSLDFMHSYFCTSCAGLKDSVLGEMGNYWSNVRDVNRKDNEKIRPRNIALTMII